MDTDHHEERATDDKLCSTDDSRKHEAQHNFQVFYSLSAPQNELHARYKYDEVKMTIESSSCHMLHDLTTLITNQIISWIEFPHV